MHVRSLRAMPLALALVLSLTASARAAGTPRDFTSEVKALYAVAACGDAAPAGYDAKIVDGHCKELAKAMATWKSKWFDLASPFFTELFKAGYPKSVVYPFGGGDLLTLLAVYPDATDYTTLSLEGMGDPRPIVDLGGGDGKEAAKRAKKLNQRLAKVRKIMAAQLGWAWNTTIQLSIDSSESGAYLPGILTMTLVALQANGYEPLEVRYFSVAADGTLVYLTQADLDAFDAEQAKLKKEKGEVKHKLTNTVQVGPFNDVEIVFRKKGDVNAPKKTFHHIAADLSDGGIDKDPGAVKYLESKGDVGAMTKAASYLLWKTGFGKIRDYLLAHMKVMVSDDTGIPPRYAGPAGFTQEVWGSYLGAYFSFAGHDVEKELVKFWKGDANKGKLPFRFGYYDNKGHAHLLYTHK